MEPTPPPAPITETTTVLAELPVFTIGTSLQDIRTKRSAFNPCPEQGNRISVWSDYHPTVDSQIIIRYEQTGQAYHATVPLSKPYPELSQPVALEQPPTSTFDSYGNSLKHWIPLTEYLPYLSLAILDSEVTQNHHVGTDTLLRAFVQPVESAVDAGQPVFKPSRTTYLDIIRAAAQALDAGDWRSAVYLATQGCSYVPSHNGKTFDEPAFSMLGYRHEGVARDAVPSISDDLTIPGNTGRIISDTADDIHHFIFSSIEVQALQVALGQNPSPAAADHIRTVMKAAEDLKSQAQSRLTERTNRSGITYFDQMSQYLIRNNLGNIQPFGVSSPDQK